MSDRLPDIDIAVVGLSKDFLDGMADLGRRSAIFHVEQHADALGVAGFHVVNFRHLGHCVHRELGFQLIATLENPTRVAVEMRAARWDPNPPTYAVYRSAALALVTPLLKTWNRTNQTRYRLRVGPQATEPFAASSRTLALMDRFALLANQSAMHPLDWERFYTLVREGRQKIPESDMTAMLKDRGFSSTAAERLANLYAHLWAFKRLR